MELSEATFSSEPQSTQPTAAPQVEVHPLLKEGIDLPVSSPSASPSGLPASGDPVDPLSRAIREQKVSVSLNCTCYRPEQAIHVSWSTNAEMDSEHDLRAWDFLAVHSAQVPCDQYDASAYMCKEADGSIEMCAPSEDGKYVVSVCRDFNIVKHAMLPERRKSFISAYGLSPKATSREAILSIGAVGFTVCSKHAAPHSR